MLSLLLLGLNMDTIQNVYIYIIYYICLYIYVCVWRGLKFHLVIWQIGTKLNETKYEPM